MSRERIAALAVAVLTLAVAGWFGWQALRPAPAQNPVAIQAVPLSEGGGIEGVETVATETDALPTGGTPMRERVAVIGLLNKRNGISREVTLKPGQAIRLGDVVIHLDACEHTAPYEQDQLTGVFVRLDVRGADGRWRRPFAGWLFRERPALNVVRHPVYDVWTKSCTMSWPDTGPDTTSLSAPRSSSAPKRPATPSADAPAPFEIAAPSNAI